MQRIVGKDLGQGFRLAQWGLWGRLVQSILRVPKARLAQWGLSARPPLRVPQPRQARLALWVRWVRLSYL